MGNNKSLEEQNAEFKKTMSETEWQRLRNISLEVAILGGMGGAVLVIVAAFLLACHLPGGAIVGQIGGYTLLLSVFNPILIRIFVFFRYRKRR